jgi:AAA+ superfamily predicted ATPase
MARSKITLDPNKKPIMSAALEAEIEAALVQYEQTAKWREWGMDMLRKQGNMVLLSGPPGTGKTTIARYMSRRVGRSMVTLNMKDVGGKAPGHTERMVHETFSQAKLSGMKTVFMDECEAIVWDRGRAGSDSMWMVGVIDEILMQVAEYKGLIVAATNRVDIVDPALIDRCFASLQVGLPEAPERFRLWKQKMPDRFPLKLTKIQFDTLAEIPLTGRQIENAIVREASMSLAIKREPNFQELLNVSKTLTK